MEIGLEILKIAIWPLVTLLLILIFLFVFYRPIKKFLFEVKRAKLGKGGEGPFLELEKGDGQSSQAVEESKPPELEDDCRFEDISEEDKEKSILYSVDLVIEGKIDEAKDAFNKYVDAVESEKERLKAKSFFYFILYTHGNLEAISEFQNLYEASKDEETKVFILSDWSFCYEKAKQYETSLDLLQDKIREIKDEKKITSLICKISKTFLFLKKNDEAYSVLTTRLNEVSSDKELFLIYKAISEVEQARGDSYMSALTLEKAYQYSYDDLNLLFNSAYKLSSIGLKGLSLYNYDMLSEREPSNSTALNNAGVSANELGLNIKSIDYYTKSSNFDESLAFANLGFGLLKSGFCNLANEMANRAIKCEEVHVNAHKLKTSIQSKRKEEEEKFNQYIEKCSSIKLKLRRYTEVYYKTDKSESCPFVGRWKSSKGVEFDVELKEENIEATSEVPNDSYQTLPGIILGRSISTSSTRYKISGSYKNNTAKLRYESKHISNVETVLKINTDRKYSCLSFLDVSTGEWEIFSPNPEDDFSIVLKRVE